MRKEEELPAGMESLMAMGGQKTPKNAQNILQREKVGAGMEI